MSSRHSLIFILLASTAPATALAQDAPAGQAPAATPATQPGDEYADDEGVQEIVVQGQKPRGSVVGDIPPENTLTSRDIRATGATSISELLDSIASQTGSARGRSSGRPI